MVTKRALIISSVCIISFMIYGVIFAPVKLYPLVFCPVGALGVLLIGIKKKWYKLGQNTNTQEGSLKK